MQLNRRHSRSLSNLDPIGQFSPNDDDPRSRSAKVNRRRPLSERRPAICEAQSFGLQLDDILLTSSNFFSSCDGSINGDFTVRQEPSSSAGLGVHYPGDLLSLARPRLVQQRPASRRIRTSSPFEDVVDGPACPDRMPYSSNLSDIERKLKHTLSVPKFSRERKLQLEKRSSLMETLLCIKPILFHDRQLFSCKTTSWCDVIPNVLTSVTDAERKRRDAVWELLTSECRFLLDHLLPLKLCFKEPLKQVQVEGQLMFAEPADMFGNLDELCQISLTFCRDFLAMMTKEAQQSQSFGRTETIVRAIDRYCELTRDGAAYEDYCIRYSNSVSYIKTLRTYDEFCQFETWCERDIRCGRLLLNDLLIAPIQHYMRVPLVLRNIIHYTQCPLEQQVLATQLAKLETRIKAVEMKMKTVAQTERLQQLARQIRWPSALEFDRRVYVPPQLKHQLSRQPCERTIFNEQRTLLHEGPTTLIEVSKKVDMYLFLFNDLLLLTKIKRITKQKLSGSLASLDQRLSTPNTDGALFDVHRQPIALDRLAVYDVTSTDDSTLPGSSLKNCLMLTQSTRFHQIIAVYTLQMPDESSKAHWLERLKEAQRAVDATVPPGECDRKLDSRPARRETNGSRECEVDDRGVGRSTSLRIRRQDSTSDGGTSTSPPGRFTRTIPSRPPRRIRSKLRSKTLSFSDCHRFSSDGGDDSVEESIHL